eukprot:jgi/Mesen1/7540/ME000391S06770
MLPSGGRTGYTLVRHVGQVYKRADSSVSSRFGGREHFNSSNEVLSRLAWTRLQSSSPASALRRSLGPGAAASPAPATGASSSIYYAGRSFYKLYLQSIRNGRSFSSAPIQSGEKLVEKVALKSPPLGGTPGFVGWYMNLLEKRPIATKSVTASAIFVAADLIAQAFAAAQADPTAPPASLDAARTARMAALGLFLSGPTLHLWFGLMSKYFPGRDVRSTLSKMALGQCTYGPSFNAVFFSLNSAAQGESRSEILGRLRRDIPATFQKGLLYWPLCDALTYRYVPVHLQAQQQLQLHAPAPARVLAHAHGHAHAHAYHSHAHAAHTHAHDALALAPPSATGFASRLRGSPGSSTSSSTSLLPGFAASPWAGGAWRGGQQRRGYVQLKTMLEVADNSGARRVECIKVLKGAKPNAAGLGDTIICAVKDALPRGKVKKGEVVTCVVVRSAMHSTRHDGSQIRFDRGAAVIVNKAGEPVGTRIFGPVPHELRAKKLVKILALAQHVT